MGLLFYIPAVAGGIFGLLGGYLTDRLGRRRVLVWSILLYAFSAMGAGFATSLTQLLILRCTTFIGVCVEFVAAVAWLAELFPESQAAREGAGLHAGVLFHRRLDGQRCVLPRGHVRTLLPRDSGRPRGLALYALVRRDPRDSADPRAAVPAGVARLAGEEGGGHTQASQLRASCSGRRSAGPLGSPLSCSR